MILERKAAVVGNRMLAALDLGVDEFLDPTAVETDQMVVMAALVKLEQRPSGLKRAAFEQASLLKLCQHPIDRGQAHILPLGQQAPIDVFGTQMQMGALLEDVDDLHARQGGL